MTTLPPEVCDHTTSPLPSEPFTAYKFPSAAPKAMTGPDAAMTMAGDDVICVADVYTALVWLSPPSATHRHCHAQATVAWGQYSVVVV